MRKVPTKYIVREDDFTWQSFIKQVLPGVLLAVAVLVWDYSIGGNMYDYRSLKLYGLCAVAIFIYLYDILKIILIPHKNKVVVIVDEDGLYLDTVDMPKPKMLLWEDILDIQLEKWKTIMDINLVSGKQISFNYRTGIDLYKFRRTVRYFSGRDDYLKKNYVFLWLQY